MMVPEFRYHENSWWMYFLGSLGLALIKRLAGPRFEIDEDKLNQAIDEAAHALLGGEHERMA